MIDDFWASPVIFTQQHAGHVPNQQAIATLLRADLTATMMLRRSVCRHADVTRHCSNYSNPTLGIQM